MGEEGGELANSLPSSLSGISPALFFKRRKRTFLLEIFSESGK